MYVRVDTGTTNNKDLSHNDDILRHFFDVRPTSRRLKLDEGAEDS